MANINIGAIIGLVVGLVLIGVLLPIGINQITAFTSTDANVQTIVSSVIPIVATVGLLMALVPRIKRS